jgi:hypothetical protein
MLKIKKNWLSSLLFFCLVIPSIWASECLVEVNKVLKNIDSELAAESKLLEHQDHRTYMARFAVKKGIPVFYKLNSAGEKVPVILLNKFTAKKLKKYLDHSFGTQVALQKNWKNDHGLLRKGDTIIDLDTPGARGFGEINETGLAWKNLYTYLELKTPQHYPVLEVSYLLSKEEKSMLEYYHRVRRAALYRVPFTFDGNESPIYPETLKEAGEHCFSFCKAEYVGDHALEILSRIKLMGLKNPQEYMQKPEIQDALKKVRDIINSTPDENLHQLMTANPTIRKLFSASFPATIKKEKTRLQFINWIISLDSTLQYEKMIKDLGVTGDYGIEDAINQRSTVIFVYDESVNVNDFKNAKYKNEGKFTEWPKTKQLPVP